MDSYWKTIMLKKELKLLAQHKSVETTKEVVELVCTIENCRPQSKIVVTFDNGETRTLKIQKGMRYYDVKQWVDKMLPNIVMIEAYSKDHPNGHIKDSYHRLGGLPDMWTLFLFFDNGEIV